MGDCEEREREQAGPPHRAEAQIEEAAAVEEAISLDELTADLAAVLARPIQAQ